MKYATRIALLPLGFAVAMAAFIHASSEARPGALGMAASFHSTLNAHELTVLVDQEFRSEMSRYSAQESGLLPGLPDPLIDLARQTYALDPLDITTLRTIALGSVSQEDSERARRLMRLAVQISKRDAVTNLWLAQDYGRAGDAEAMTASFDHALRTSLRAREMAMKPVVELIASEDSYAPLARLLERQPEWEGAFWREFARNPVAVSNAAKFFEGAGIPVDRIPEGDRNRLYTNLKQARQFESLYRLAALDADADAGMEALAAGEFVTADEGNPLGWMLRSRGTYAARIHRSSGELQIDARSGSFGVVADRIIRGGGDYRLAIVLAEAVPDNAELELTVECANDSNEELASIPIGPGERSGKLDVRLDVCDFASVELSFAVDPGRRDALIRVESIGLHPS